MNGLAWMAGDLAWRTFRFLAYGAAALGLSSLGLCPHDVLSDTWLIPHRSEGAPHA
jgi:hypothetical protein